LAAFLADSYAYPKREIKLDCPTCNKKISGAEETQDLLRVSQYVANNSGLGALYQELHRIFDDDYPPTLLHQFLATLPAVLKAKGFQGRELLIVTTNYDDLMERAFQKAGQEFDILTYVAEGDHRGRFLHWPHEGEPVLIEKPNKYAGISLEQRPTILKIHGAVNRINRRQDSYVIREDDYIDYLSRTTDIANVLPSTIVAKLKESHLLFLGYSLSDWNLRVILYRIWSALTFDYKSWAIQVNPQRLDQQFWSKRDVDILNIYLEEYVSALQSRI